MCHAKLSRKREKIIFFSFHDTGKLCVEEEMNRIFQGDVTPSVPISFSPQGAVILLMLVGC